MRPNKKYTTSVYSWQPSRSRTQKPVSSPRASEKKKVTHAPRICLATPPPTSRCLDDGGAGRRNLKSDEKGTQTWISLKRELPHSSTPKISEVSHCSTRICILYFLAIFGIPRTQTPSLVARRNRQEDRDTRTESAAPARRKGENIWSQQSVNEMI
jgi:hypothetical protein